MAKKQSDKNPFENMTFEQAIETLGAIVQKIETGQVPLEESLRQYEQGMGLIGHCRKILLDAEKRIEVIHDSTRPDASAAAGDNEELASDAADDDQQAEADDDDGLF